MKEIEINSKKYGQKTILVDDDDFDYLSQFKWCVLKRGQTFYAFRRKNYKSGYLMHREILGLSDSQVQVDHKDHNGLNNQKVNIRSCSRSQNMFNKSAKKGATSKYVGVNLNRRDGKWIAEIKNNYKKKYIGIFEKEEDAAIAYNNAAKLIHGEFANLNII